MDLDVDLGLDLGVDLGDDDDCGCGFFMLGRVRGRHGGSIHTTHPSVNERTEPQLSFTGYRSNCRATSRMVEANTRYSTDPSVTPSCPSTTVSAI